MPKVSKEIPPQSVLKFYLALGVREFFDLLGCEVTHYGNFWSLRASDHVWDAAGFCWDTPKQLREFLEAWGFAIIQDWGGWDCWLDYPHPDQLQGKESANA